MSGSAVGDELIEPGPASLKPCSVNWYSASIGKVIAQSQDHPTRA